MRSGKGQVILMWLTPLNIYTYIYMCVCVAIHALASMPSAPRLSEADSKTSTEVPCLYALRMPHPSLLQKHSNCLGHKCMLIIPQIKLNIYMQSSFAKRFQQGSLWQQRDRHVAGCQGNMVYTYSVTFLLYLWSADDTSSAADDTCICPYIWMHYR
jgi:hypothetical protein